MTQSSTVDEWKTHAQRWETEANDLLRQNELLQERLDHAVSWLRRQANAEKEPKAKAAFVEAHNALLAIAQGSFDPGQTERK